MAATQYQTTDIGLAAFFKLKGEKLIGYEKGAFIFATSPERAKELAIEFANSECSKFDHAVRYLKKLMYQ